MQEIENAVDTVQEVEIIDSPVAQDDSVVDELQSEVTEDQELAFDLDRMLDEILGNMDNEVVEEKAWPSFDKGIVHKSEQEALALAQSQKNDEMIAELELLKAEAENNSKERDEALAELTEIQKKIEQSEAQEQQYEEFFSKLTEIPVLGKLVSAVAEGKTVDIPAYFNELQKKKIGVLGESPLSETPPIKVQEKSATDMFIESMNNGNKIRGLK